MTDRGIIAMALALSVALHLGALALAAGRQAPAIEGGAASSEPAQLGNSFRDLAQGSVATRPTAPPGTLAPTRPDTRSPGPAAAAASAPQPAAEAPAPAPSRTLPRAPTETAASPSPEASPAPQAEPAPRVATAAVVPAPAIRPVETIARRAPSATAAPLTEPARPAETVAATPMPAVLPAAEAPPQTIATVVPPKVATATAETPRPAPRPDRRAGAATPPEPQASRAASASGAERAERRGQDDGQETAVEASRADTPSPAARAEPGNAAASTYSGRVMRQLSRTPRPQGGRRGTAVVGFELGSRGEVRQAVILRSSGHDAIDRAALEHVRRAAPFPPPPQGAGRRFQVHYESRG